ncbi:MAG: N-acetylmuramoyl-L-alanine amidase [Monoglobus pectinilyticus]|uniref:N-acetylmuramoyl-L-alanine amidase family protein n=1 Tax=Monoglobus pectinilyticus TaxID=1981510 RepID=UPI00300EFBA6
MLINSGQTVKMSRDSITDTVSSSLNGSLAYRYNSANDWNADIFVSIHCNAANTKAYGCETYYCTGSTQGRALAECVQPNMAAETERYNRGVKSANFAVIKHTNMPAILVETAFIDNYDDNRFLASEDGKYKCATAIYKGICDYLGIEYKLESEDELMSREYEELKAENDRQNDIINQMGTELEELRNTAKSKIYDYIDDNMPEWARPTITKLVDKGFLKGDEEGKLGLTYDLMRMLIINDRAGDIWGVIVRAEQINLLRLYFFGTH